MKRERGERDYFACSYLTGQALNRLALLHAYAFGSGKGQTVSSPQTGKSWRIHV